VTIPHKETATRAIEQPSAAVVRTGACNSFWLEKGRVCGDNTDVEGFVHAVQLAFGDLAGARVLLVGAGGAARAVLLGLETLGAAQVQVFARSPARAAQLAPILAGSRTRLVAGNAQPSSCDMVVNATPLGLHDDDTFPWPLAELAPHTRIFDLVYRRGETAWVRAARAAGFPSADGQEMLVQQAAASFLRWWQREPPVDQMRLALAGTAS
jgi:shikimate dehydrogenase